MYDSPLQNDDLAAVDRPDYFVARGNYPSGSKKVVHALHHPPFHLAAPEDDHDGHDGDTPPSLDSDSAPSIRRAYIPEVV